MKRIEVDFNQLTRDGLVKGSASRASGQLEVGDLVEAYDRFEPDMVYDAEVVRIDDDGPRVAIPGRERTATCCVVRRVAEEVRGSARPRSA